MPEDKVTFKANGEYMIGAPLQEMDVHRDPNAAAGGAADTPAPTTTSQTGGSKAAGPKKFDMSKLRKNAGAKKGAKAKAEPADEPKPAEAAATPKRTKKEKQVPPVKEEVKPAPAPEPAPEPEAVEGTHKEIPPELMDPPPVHVPGGDPPIPAPDTKEFKLQQLGVTSRPEAEEPPAEEVPVEQPKPPVQKLELGTLGRSKKDTPAQEGPATEVLPSAERQPKTAPTEVREAEPVPEPVASTPKQSVTEMNLGKVSEGPAPAAASSVPETAETAPEFVFHTLDEFLALTGLELQDLSVFSKAVAKAVLRGGSIWQSKKHPMLRAYSCVVPTGRAVPRTARYLFTVGWDVHVTSCYVDQNHLVTDGSANLKCEGICAFVQGTPVALSLERKRDAVVV